MSEVEEMTTLLTNCIPACVCILLAPVELTLPEMSSQCPLPLLIGLTLDTDTDRLWWW